MITDTDLTKMVSDVVAGADAGAIITAYSVAETVINEFDPDKSSVKEIRFCAFRHLTDVARSVLRRSYDPIPERDEQLELLPDLQDRYSVVREIAGHTQHAYVPRMQLTLTERLEIADKFTRIGDTYHRRADALRAETYRLKQTGEI